MEKIIAKADVLVEALPYIRRFAGKTFVIKYGGQAMVNDLLKSSVARDLVLLNYIGVRTVVIHGGGREVTDLMQRLGKEACFANGLRVTDRETIELAEMVLVGKINKQIVGLINRHGGRAVGLSGKDSNLIIARRKQPQELTVDGQRRLVDYGFVGDVERINPEVLHTLNDRGYMPVIAPIGVSGEGDSLNINADHVAGALAAHLRAEKLILLTDVEGIFADPQDSSTLISHLPADRAVELIDTGQISRGMIPKVQSCLTALDGGVRATHIIDGRVMHSLLLEIFTNKGIGTMVNGQERPPSREADSDE